MMQRVGDNIGIVSAIKEKTMGLTIDHQLSLQFLLILKTVQK